MGAVNVVGGDTGSASWHFTSCFKSCTGSNSNTKYACGGPLASLKWQRELQEMQQGSGCPPEGHGQ